MNQDQLFYDEMSTPVGPISIIADQNAIVRIDFGTFEQVKLKVSKWLSRYFTNPNFSRGHRIINDTISELQEYFSNEREQFTVPCKLYGTSFQKAVWNATEQSIPFGKTKTYKQVAELIDNEKAVRAIGGALNKNPCSIVVPCHRVIGSSGEMIGYGGGLDKKTYLLHAEQL